MLYQLIQCHVESIATGIYTASIHIN